MKGQFLVFATVAALVSPAIVSDAVANGGFRHVQGGGSIAAPTRGFASPVVRRLHHGPVVVRPVFVPVGAAFVPIQGLRRQTFVINNNVVINAPRSGPPTVSELPVVMGIRRTPSADPIIHQVGRSFSVTSVRTHQHTRQNRRGQRDPGTGSPIQFQSSGSVSSSIIVVRNN
jgi:hypothetical protein